MPNCGIRKYDDLPGRVGWADVDYLRFRLLDNQKKIEYLQNENIKIKEQLDMVIKQEKLNGRRR